MSMTEEDEQPLPPPDASRPAAAPVPRVYRSRHRVVAGVAGGLANAVGVAPMWSRLAFVVLTLFGGLGIALYLAAWLLMPAGPGAPLPGMARRVAGLALVPLWLLAVGGGRGLLLVRGAFGLVIVLVGVAAALWSPRSVPVVDPPVAPGPPGATAVAAGTVARPVEDPPPARPRSPLGRATLGVALVVAAVGTAISGGSPTGIKVAFGLAALLCGVGLVVSAWHGWARWLIVPALVFAGVSVAGASMEGLGVHLNGSRGEASWTPGDPAHPTPPTLIRQSGGAYLRLQDIEHPVDGVIRVGAGNVQLDVADDVRVEIHARVGIGRIELPNGSKQGYRREASYAEGPSDAPLVRYDIAVGLGSVEVHRFDPNQPPVPEPSLPDRRPGVIGGDGAGGLLFVNGTHQLRDGTIVLPDGSVVAPNGERTYAAGARALPSGVVVLGDGAQVAPDGTVTFPDGVVIVPLPPGAPTPTTVPAAPPPTSAAPAPTAAPPATAPPATVAPATVPTTAVPQP